MEMRKEVLKALKHGRAEVEKGWCKRDFYDLRGNVCALGGLRKMFPDDLPMSLNSIPMITVYDKAAAALNKQLPRGWKGVASYNDHHATTKEDILALYDRAIACLEREEDES